MTDIVTANSDIKEQNEKLQKEVSDLKKEILELKEHLKKYTAPSNMKKYYVKHKNEIKIFNDIWCSYISLRKIRCD